MPAGRPLKFETPEELQAAVDAYFESLAEGEPPTVSGLAYHLDVDTKTIRNYEGREEFFPTVKRAKQRIEMHLERCLYGNSVTGLIFNLKNNFGWKDKTEQDVNANIHGGVLAVPGMKTPEEWDKLYKDPE